MRCKNRTVLSSIYENSGWMISDMILTRFGDVFITHPRGEHRAVLTVKFSLSSHNPSLEVNSSNY